MGYAMGTNFMPRLNHASKELVVLFTPVYFTPTRMLKPAFVNWVSVCDHEKCSPETVLVEDGNGAFKLASQSIVKSKGNKRWPLHCITSFPEFLVRSSLSPVPLFRVPPGLLGS